MILYLVGLGAAAVVATLLFLIAIALRRVVPTNMVHIVQSSKATVSYGKGQESGNVYYEWPSFIPGLGVVVSRFPESVFDITLSNYEAYDSGRLPFVVDVMAYFRVSDSGTAAHRVSSFDELQGQLKAVLQGAVRRVLGTNALELIMSDRAKLGAEFTEEVDAQLAEWGVKTVKSIEFMDLRDAPGHAVIANIMAKEQSRIERESRVAVADNQQQAGIAEIDAQRQVDVRKVDAAQQVGLRQATQEKEVGIAREQANQEVLAQAKETRTRQIAVQQVEEVGAAQIAQQVAVVAAERDKQVRIVQADADKATAIVKAEGEKAQTETVSEGQLTAAKNAAVGVEAQGRAKASAEAALLLAPVTAQMTLAKEIGANEGYQSYLVRIEQVRASQAVGVEQAKALQAADVKVIVNGGDVQSGVASIGDLFSSKGGVALAGMLTGAATTEEGKAVVSRITGKAA